MANSLLSILLIFLLININLSHAADDLITKVCSKTLNQPLCYNTLKSNPRAARADLKGLGSISIEISKNDAKSTYNYIASLSKQAGGDKKLKDRYDTCSENYDSTIDDLDTASQALAKNDISTYRTHASAALDGPSTCEDSFEGTPAAPPQLQKANKKSDGLIQIVLAVGALLAGE